MKREQEVKDAIGNLVEVGELYDLYGELLTGRQRQCLELYYNENLSLSEIAFDLSISRQGVHESLRHAQKLLETYEDKLGLLKKSRLNSKGMLSIKAKVSDLKKQIGDETLDSSLDELLAMLEEFNL